jgi:hypothetical protein
MVGDLTMKNIINFNNIADVKHNGSNVNTVVISGGGNTQTVWSVGGSTTATLPTSSHYVNSGPQIFTTTYTLSTPIRASRTGAYNIKTTLTRNRTGANASADNEGYWVEFYYGSALLFTDESLLNVNSQANSPATMSMVGGVLTYSSTFAVSYDSSVGVLIDKIIWYAKLGSSVAGNYPCTYSFSNRQAIFT